MSDELEGLCCDVCGKQVIDDEEYEVIDTVIDIVKDYGGTTPEIMGRFCSEKCFKKWMKKEMKKYEHRKNCG